MEKFFDKYFGRSPFSMGVFKKIFVFAATKIIEFIPLFVIRSIKVDWVE